MRRRWTKVRRRPWRVTKKVLTNYANDDIKTGDGAVVRFVAQSLVEEKKENERIQRE
jgi:hypothetical protein